MRSPRERQRESAWITTVATVGMALILALSFCR
jgi:hypothetical protein